jgi:hypothetical protein
MCRVSWYAEGEEARRLARLGRDPKLAEHLWDIPEVPEIDRFTVGHTDEVHVRHGDGTPGGGQSASRNQVERAEVRARHRGPARHNEIGRAHV